MLRLGAVVMQVSDVDRAAAFWSAALGYEKQPSNPAFLVPDDVAPGTRLHLDDEDRTHLDLWADDEADQQAQVERLISLGARRVDESSDGLMSGRTHPRMPQAITQNRLPSGAARTMKSA